MQKREGSKMFFKFLEVSGKQSSLLMKGEGRRAAVRSRTLRSGE